MPVTIVADVGSASANSFLTLAEAQSYMDGRLNSSAWSSATDDNKNIALVEATREISNKGYVGERVTSTQTLAWPRQWAVDPDSPTGWYFDTSVVPQRVKYATAELAFQFLKAGTADLASSDPNAGVVEKTVDVLTTRWDINRRPTGVSRFTRVMDYLRPLLCGSANSAEVVRG